MNRRSSDNINFRLERFEQKIGFWGVQLARMKNLTVWERVQIIKMTALPAILYGLEFS